MGHPQGDRFCACIAAAEGHLHAGFLCFCNEEWGRSGYFDHPQGSALSIRLPFQHLQCPSGDVMLRKHKAWISLERPVQASQGRKEDLLIHGSHQG